MGRSLRPHQWVKNSLVFGALIFSRSLGVNELAWMSLWAFVAFCMASSGVYLLNDLCDLEQDRAHPTKRLRPIAAGELHPTSAAILMGILLSGSAALALWLKPAFGGILGGYLLLNVAYSLAVKHQVILDVMSVAMGFVLRSVAGAVVIGVRASPWLIVCTLMLALLVSFGKRRTELTVLESGAGSHRRCLDGYSIPFLDLMLSMMGGAAVLTYALYTMADDTVARLGTPSLILTTPWVLYGVIRYLYLVHHHAAAGDPARLLFTDAPSLVNGVLWVSAVCLILYGPRGWQPW
jgi:4-hydroxybenzoate polyprenyltransferase